MPNFIERNISSFSASSFILAQNFQYVMCFHHHTFACIQAKTLSHAWLFIFSEEHNFSNGKFIIEILSENKNIVSVVESKEVIVITWKMLSFMLQCVIVRAFNGDVCRKAQLGTKEILN